MKHCLENARGVAKVRANVISEWPEHGSALEGAKTIVFIGDIFPPERMDDPAKIKADLAKLMARGCGIVCIHYATGLGAPHVTAEVPMSIRTSTQSGVAVASRIKSRPFVATSVVYPRWANMPASVCETFTTGLATTARRVPPEAAKNPSDWVTLLDPA